MDSLHTGSDELVYIQTDKVNVTIKGPAAHPNNQGVEYQEGDSAFKVYCCEMYDISLKGCANTGAMASSGGSGMRPERKRVGCAEINHMA